MIHDGITVICNCVVLDTPIPIIFVHLVDVGFVSIFLLLDMNLHGQILIMQLCGSDLIVKRFELDVLLCCFGSLRCTCALT